MDLNIKGKRVLVLAASSGLGFGVAKAYAQEGAIVAMSSSSLERVTDAAAKISNAKPFVCDLTEKGSSSKLVKEVVSDLGGIDILITNTGGPAKGDFMDLSSEDWEKGFQLVFLSAVEAMREALITMKQQKWGRIINILSVSAREPIPRLTISTGFRTGLLGLLKSICHEVAKDQITINAILPGYTATERLKSFAPEEQLIKEVPMHRIGTVEELAALATFLGSNLAGYITGQYIACDGGVSHSV